MWQPDGWGWRARIGVLTPHADVGPEAAVKAIALLRPDVRVLSNAQVVEQFNEPSAPGHADSAQPRWPASEDVDENSYEPLIDVPTGLIVTCTPHGGSLVSTAFN